MSPRNTVWTLQKSDKWELCKKWKTKVCAELLISKVKEAKLKTVYCRRLKWRPERKKKGWNDVMKQCEYEMMRRLLFVVHTRVGERGEDKRRKEKRGHDRREEKWREETRWEEKKGAPAIVKFLVRSLHYFRMLQTQKNRGYTEPNITSHTWKTTENSNSWLVRQPPLGSTILPHKHEQSR